MAMAASQGGSEITPTEISAAVLEFAESLSSTKPVKLPAIEDPLGLYGWSADGVREKIKREGGSIVFGWVIWEWPNVLLTAEFHAVWKDPKGALIDITPKPRRESSIIFVADKSYSSDFNYGDRPRNQRWSLYGEGDDQKRVATQIGRMSASQLSYETKRAAKTGKSLEYLLLAKLPKDPLPDLIERYIVASEHRDRAFDAMPHGSSPSPEYSRYRSEADRLMNAIIAAVAA